MSIAITSPSPARDRQRPAPRRWLRWLALLALVAVYPVAVLAYVYWHSLTSGLPGGRHGPQDAYRHALASAVVAYTLSPRAVGWVSAVMEPSPTDPGDRMDRHNNAIGASIGGSARSLAALRREVERRVLAGRTLAADPDQITWLPPSEWRNLPI